MNYETITTGEGIFHAPRRPDNFYKGKFVNKEVAERQGLKMEQL